jgi:hypothetical protein
MIDVVGRLFSIVNMPDGSANEPSKLLFVTRLIGRVPDAGLLLYVQATVPVLCKLFE